MKKPIFPTHIEVTLGEETETFKFRVLPSSNVHFFGINETKMFVMFKNGSAYVYEGLTHQQNQAIEYPIESIGKIVSRDISKTCPATKLNDDQIIYITPETI